MSRAGLYWETLRHLKPSQLAWQLLRRASPLPAHRPVGAEAVRDGVRPRPFARPVVPAVGAAEISFLNRARPLDPDAMDWASRDAPKLWRYNLHYFDYLHWPVYPAAAKARLIDSWIAGHPAPAGDGWEPYPLSLRAVNWIRWWLTEPASQPVPTAWRDSLATQLAGLETRLEYHLLANHLVKNGKALLFGGLFFNGPRADRWRELGLRILVREAGEQLLPDGGHYERSPMYHCIVLEDYLDAVNLLRACPGVVPAAAEATLVAAATRALGFLAGITAGDGRIPLFNDSAFGIAPEPDELLAYGERLGIAPVGAASAATPFPPESSPRVSGGKGVAAEAAPTRIEFPNTGYYGYRHAGESLIVDCGPVGPDYQPGHAHCDTLSFELCVAGRRVVVDTGVWGYEADELRDYVRRTASHNTVALDGAEQSGIWGAFRVARRARPLSPTLQAGPDGSLEFRGAHDGYRRLPDQPVHSRRIRMQRGGPWEVFDLISGAGGGTHRALGYLHLGPDLEVTAEGPGTFLLRHPAAGLLLRVSVTGGSQTRLESGYHFPEFGLRRDNKIIIIEREDKLPLEMHYRIERLQTP
ncbi:MAG: alginate lyase family protein [Chromatiales bacterium]|nr:alginate lyase family protein [Chromatiales bacterium]